MILSSVKSYGAYSNEFIPKFFTLSPTFENYSLAFTSVPLLKYFINSFVLIWYNVNHYIIRKILKITRAIQ